MALCTALALFHAVWGDMERLVSENDNCVRDENGNVNGNNSNNMVEDDNNDNNNNVKKIDDKYDENNTNILTKKDDRNDNKNVENNFTKNPSKTSTPKKEYSSSLSLSHYFGIALERSFPELSDLEMFQVCELFFSVLYFFVS